MADQAEVAAQIRTWMRSVLAEKGWTAAAWAKKAQLAPTTVQRPLKDDYEFVTSSRTLAKLADAAAVEAPSFASARESQLVPAFLTVRHKVQAGHWFEVDDYAQVAPDDASHPVAPDPRYAEWPQWLELVVGDSVNLRIPEGGYAHVVDAIEMGYAPRHGDFVVVERRRAGGSIRERTIKQVALDGAGVVELWPRSTNQRWSKPIVLTDGVPEEEDVEVEIVGLVIGAYSAFV
jgi:lambda repressor-like predicted transcriptional regulator